jgi:hypothetical protein
VASTFAGETESTPLLIGSITMLGALRRRAAHNGLELSCPAARATAYPFSRTSAGRGSPTFRTPAGSAAARGCVKTPISRIAFPLEARIARLQSTLAPLPCQSAQALRDRSPPARLFTQSGELLCGLHRQGVGRCATAPHHQTPPAAHCRSPPPDTSGKTPLSSATR